MVLCICSIHLASHAQVQLEVEGLLSVETLPIHSEADSVVVWLQDKTLGFRMASSLTEHQILSISNDTVFLQDGGLLNSQAMEPLDLF